MVEAELAPGEELAAAGAPPAAGGAFPVVGVVVAVVVAELAAEGVLAPAGPPPAAGEAVPEGDVAEAVVPGVASGAVGCSACVIPVAGGAGWLALVAGGLPALMPPAFGAVPPTLGVVPPARIPPTLLGADDAGLLLVFVVVVVVLPVGSVGVPASAAAAVAGVRLGVNQVERIWSLKMASAWFSLSVIART